MHIADGALLVMLATIFAAFERIGLAVTVGGVGFGCWRAEDRTSPRVSEKK
jgi:hypothetical protein